jgi:poly-gamma-glutamate capsule biosynthesis protein CapA/YwtB (metallophosphatase superfamily)
MATPQHIEWAALVPRFQRCNVTGLRADQVGFVADASPRAAWTEIPIQYTGPILPLEKIEQFFDRRLHCGSLRLRARAKVDNKLRETPVLEVRRYVGSGFRAALTEQFALPYLFGSGELVDGPNTGPETNLGTDCANFVVYALRRQGLRIPWSDPKKLRDHLDCVAAPVAPGSTRFTADELERGLIVHLGTHVAAVVEDRAPMGVLDDNDLVAHQLKGTPETLTLRELLRDRNKQTFDLFRVPGKSARTILFGGDIMLGRSCATRIEQGLDPFRGIASLLRQSDFVAANLECTICDSGKLGTQNGYSFRAPFRSAALLRAAGIRAVGLANNHALDFGVDGLAQCAQTLISESITPVGVGPSGAGKDPYSASVFKLRDGKKLALLAINDVGSNSGFASPIASATERAKLSAAIARARSQADLIACMVHWGIENTGIVTEDQRELGRWLIDRGVDLVVGSHPHCLQPLDFYHGCPIAYSLGNLVFDGAPSVPSWNQSALLEIGLSANAKIASTRLIPIVLENGFPKAATPGANPVLAKQ